jgi:hypothetical protein
MCDVADRVKTAPNKQHGKVFGRLVWKGVPKGVEEEVRCPLKRQWSLVAFPFYKEFSSDSESMKKLIPAVKQ